MLGWASLILGAIAGSITLSDHIKNERKYSNVSNPKMIGCKTIDDFINYKCINNCAFKKGSPYNIPLDQTELNYMVGRIRNGGRYTDSFYRAYKDQTGRDLYFDAFPPEKKKEDPEQ